MQATRNALFAFALIVSLAAVACQPTDDLIEPGTRTTHPVIEVPDGPTMLPPARPTAKAVDAAPSRP